MLVRKSNKYYFSQISFKLRESLLLRNYETQTTRWLFAPLFFFDRIPDNSSKRQIKGRVDRYEKIVVERIEMFHHY